MNCFRYLKLMSPLNAAICTTIYLERQKCYGPDKKILFKKQLFDLEVKGQGPTKLLRYVTHRLMVMHPHTKYHWPISKDENVMVRTRKYYLKNNLTLRSKVKAPRRSLRYVTHRLMVMHPHTKYHWPIWKDKKVMVRTSFAEKKRKKKSD
jgi:acyl-CoA thioesterase FadM